MAHSCCNPFNLPGHSSTSRKKNLRAVTAWMCEQAPQMSIGSKIFDTCRKKLSKERPASVTISDTSSETEEVEVYVQTPEAVSSLNRCLADLGETPYLQIKGRGKNCSRKKG